MHVFRVLNIFQIALQKYAPQVSPHWQCVGAPCSLCNAVISMEAGANKVTFFLIKKMILVDKNIY